MEDRSRRWLRDLIDCRSTDYCLIIMCRLGRILRNVVGFTGVFVVGFDNKIVTFSRCLGLILMAYAAAKGILKR